jgi:hypothetical protein
VDRVDGLMEGPRRGYPPTQDLLPEERRSVTTFLSRQNRMLSPHPNAPSAGTARALQFARSAAFQFMLFTAIALSVIAVLLLVLYLRSRARRSSQSERQRFLKAEKFDTTLGEFHDMREALRPLTHTRTASRRDPNVRE